MCDTADLLHHIPGRIRLRIPAAKGNVEKLRGIQQSLGELAGIQAVEINVLLGTIVIRYDLAQFTGFTAQLAVYATEHGLFAIGGQSVGPCISDAQRSLNGFLGTLNRAVQEAMGNALNLKELLPLALGFYGLLFVNKSAAAAQWLNWIQFAIDTYMDLHEAEPTAELAQTMEAHFADLMAQQAQSTEALRSELVALRSEMQILAKAITPQSRVDSVADDIGSAGTS
ncbi:MAG TPA: hypothetical protein VLJ11_19440 [Bryobacteraceae bacterium]|nr:hypothetical protein [Bryobacteraceae bacterium]